MQRRRVSEELRNIAPREGTEIVAMSPSSSLVQPIKKYSSPRGDGNQKPLSITAFQVIKKYSSPRGDGNFLQHFLD